MLKGRFAQIAEFTSIVLMLVGFFAMKQSTGSVVYVKDTTAASPWKTGAYAPTPTGLLKSRL
jgi:hypothetical protein